MKKLSVLLLVSFLSFEIFNCSCFAYSSASSLKRDLNSINRDIQNNKRKISSIKSSSRISDYDKKRQIQKLERQNYYLKQKSNKIKREYARAIS